MIRRLLAKILRDTIIEEHELNQQCRSADCWEEIHDSAHLAADIADDLGRSPRGDPRIIGLLRQMDEAVARLVSSQEAYKQLRIR